MKLAERRKIMIKIYQTSSEYLEETQEFLCRRECVSQLILFNALVHKGEEKTKQVFFGNILDENGLILLSFGNCFPYNLCIYMEEKSKLSSNLCKKVKEAVKELCNYIIKEDISIHGINANEFICEIFLANYNRKDGKQLKKILAMDIMEIRTLKDISLACGTFRLAKKEEALLIANWKKFFEKEALGIETKEEEEIKDVENSIEKERVYVFCNQEDTLVSMAFFARELLHGGVINYVFTPVEYRGKKYAQTNIYYLSKEILEKGYQFVSLFVDKTNPISNQVYQKVGYNIIEENYSYEIVE